MMSDGLPLPSGWHHLPPPSYHASLAERRHRQSIHLIKGVQWTASGLDAPHSLPSPPMSDSPTSPKRSQFSESRPVHPVSAISAPPTATFAPASSIMTSQVLPAPSGLPHYGYGAPTTDPGVSGYLASYHRSRAQSNPSQHGAFMPTAPSMGLPMGYGGPQPLYQFSAGVSGPLSSAAASKLTRSGSRRAKAHVAKACQNCKKAHLSCDEHRPCNRCIATRKEVGSLNSIWSNC
jgi:hypothetical protein